MNSTVMYSLDVGIYSSYPCFTDKKSDSDYKQGPVLEMMEMWG